MRPETAVVHAGRPPHEADQPLSVGLTMAATFVAGGDREYGRNGNPTWEAFEQALGALEGGRALAFASGVAAIGTVLDLVPPGGRVVVPQHAYQGSLAQLADLEGSDRVTITRVDVENTDAVVSASQGAALVLLESPTNPALEVADLAAVIPAVRDSGARVLVDNTFATPLLQQPLTLGADVVVHSATKYLAGHSDVLLGALVTADDGLHDELRARRYLRGVTPGTLETWLAVRGMRTLALRVERAGANAAELARRLAEHPAVARVRYPGLGAIVAVEPAGGVEAADRLVAATSLWVHATSLGGVESTLERRRRWPGESPSIPESLVRLSVGIEDVEDLWEDLQAGL